MAQYNTSNNSFLSRDKSIAEVVYIGGTISGNTLVGGSGGGSTGLDFSANKPTIPVVANATFSSTGIYAGYVLVATVTANTSRSNIDIENISGANIAVIRDDGAAANNAAANNASVFTLSGGLGSGSQGGSWTSATFKGRIQVYAPVSNAVVSIFTD
jgi:hypothetical protein